jgi:Mrp family chromosome partitioning ATPase/predicted Fe-Mo cluster-binding NifX family protein
MSSCNHDCENCKDKCEDESFLKKPHLGSSIKKVIGVVSGKGGVGKSLVTSLLASAMRQKGYQVGILDADITGPSIPKMFGIRDKARGNEQGLIPNASSTGIKIISSNLLLKNDTDPVVWRGPVIANLVEQFWTEVIWQDIDYLFVDMPPGTGDVPLTVFQSMGVDGIVIVTSPQELVKMIVSKAVKMAGMMKIPVVGLVENMSYLECDECQHPIKIFGESHVDEIASEFGLHVLAKIPLNPKVATLCDAGQVEQASTAMLNKAIDCLEQLPLKALHIALPIDNGLINVHFGHADQFLMVTSCHQTIVASKVITPAKGHEELATCLEENNINVVLTQNIGVNMRELLTDRGIEVISGVQGDAMKVATLYLRNELKQEESKHDCEEASCDACPHCDECN